MQTGDKSVNTMEQPTLPPHVRALQSEVEDLAHSPVRWESSSKLGGAMRLNIESGTPVIRYREFTVAGAAEELMHLKLGFSGIPRLSCPQNLHLVAQAATMLENALHHHIIFPELEELGYDPKRSECEGVTKQLDVISSADYSRIETKLALQAMFAMVYARAKLYCDDADFSARVDTIFQTVLLKNVRCAGEKVFTTIRRQSSCEAQACRPTFQSGLSALGIANHVSITG